MVLKPIDELSTSEIKRHFVSCITNHMNTIGEVKEVLDFFECNGIEDLSPYENEQRDNLMLSLERLHNEIYHLSKLVDYDEIYGGEIKEYYDEQFGEGRYEESYPNGHIYEYLKDYYRKTYVLEDEEVKEVA